MSDSGIGTGKSFLFTDVIKYPDIQCLGDENKVTVSL